MAEVEVAEGSEDQAETVRISTHSLELLLRENRELRKQVDELQKRGSEMAMERQRWRDSGRIKRIAESQCLTAANEGRAGYVVDFTEAMRALVEVP